MKKQCAMPCILVVVILLLSVIPVGAATFAPYASGQFTFDAEAGKLSRSNNSFSLEKGVEVNISGVYMPNSANLNVGILDSSTGVFYSQRATDGKIDVTITVLKRGDYYLAFRNNSDDIVSITGYIS